jgi:hypothetical protein
MMKPWESEPDRLEWRAHGLACLIVRNGLGTLCGYVGVPRQHPWYGAGLEAIEDRVSVHGGLTYSAPCRDHICHSDPTPVHWFGFDCSHYGDLIPGKGALSALFPFPTLDDGTYRTIGYVKAETERLARQLARQWPRLKERRRKSRELARLVRATRGALVQLAGMRTKDRSGRHIRALVHVIGMVCMPVRIPRSLR